MLSHLITSFECGCLGREIVQRVAAVHAARSSRFRARVVAAIVAGAIRVRADARSRRSWIFAAVVVSRY